ncbi:hypothetical protein [Pelagibaculum spongiae]|uniref:Phosphatidylinositol diacylglycerol-lyase n=1 Tax=Pelagibaculum spongiae TaxID=2080658 RepID=A0A2V1GVU6_9GAMM|nr:hypothetical protein [Pelagibaculum spongiae]PVZ67777.1 hypothetical protein DC094_15200 [Pelagibaculum spongiae]
MQQLLIHAPGFASKRLIDIVMPGSHDSATYTLNSMKSFSVTQTKTLREQFLMGVRYFDIRLKQKGEGLVFFHGIISSDVRSASSELASFFSTVLLSNEVVILKLHFDNTSSYDLFERNFMSDILNRTITPSDFRTLSIKWLIANNKNIALLVKNGYGETEYCMDYEANTFGGWGKTRDSQKLTSKIESSRFDPTENIAKLKVVQTNQPALVGSGSDRFLSVLEHDQKPESRQVTQGYIETTRVILKGTLQRQNTEEKMESTSQIRGVVSMDNVGGDTGKTILLLEIIALNYKGKSYYVP